MINPSVSTLDILKLYLYVIKLSLRKKNRNYSLIDQEYNSGQWNKAFEEIDFETLDGNYDRKDMDEYNIFTIDGQLKKINRRDYDVKFKKQHITVNRNNLFR